MRAKLVLAILLTVGALAAWLLWPRPMSQDTGYSLQGLLGGEAEGYAQAVQPRQFRFPADHGAHPDYRSEWWYLTGNLFTADGRRFGFQFTIFRLAMSPHEREGQSSWGTRQAYMAHFTLTDLETGRFHAFERFARGAVGLAGAQSEPLRIWLEDWQLSGEGEHWRLQAREGDVGLDLRLEPAKAPVLQGDQGLSQKGPEPGNASYYYTYSRISADGELSVAGQTLGVSGSAWLDREWSTSVLSPDVAGWDWFALQLADGSDLMLYQLRRHDGSSTPFSAATYVPPQGPPQRIESFQLQALETWTSPATGARYPSRWRVRIPSLDAELFVTAAQPDQELDLAVRYWEGAVDVGGRFGGERASGYGYMELTGYGGGGVGRAQ